MLSSGDSAAGDRRRAGGELTWTTSVAAAVGAEPTWRTLKVAVAGEELTVTRTVCGGGHQRLEPGMTLETVAARDDVSGGRCRSRAHVTDIDAGPEPSSCGRHRRPQARHCRSGAHVEDVEFETGRCPPLPERGSSPSRGLWRWTSESGARDD
jgi:hypothetical protein